jgi:hypothetical protein
LVHVFNKYEYLACIDCINNQKKSKKMAIKNTEILIFT